MTRQMLNRILPPRTALDRFLVRELKEHAPEHRISALCRHLVREVCEEYPDPRAALTAITSQMMREGENAIALASQTADLDAALDAVRNRALDAHAAAQGVRSTSAAARRNR